MKNWVREVNEIKAQDTHETQFLMREKVLKAAVVGGCGFN